MVPFSQTKKGGVRESRAQQNPKQTKKNQYHCVMQDKSKHITKQTRETESEEQRNVKSVTHKKGIPPPFVLSLSLPLLAMDRK